MSSPPQREDFAVGDVVQGINTPNTYTIEKVLKGGFGIVYIAKQDGIPCALKTFQARFLWRDEERERFLREAVTWLMLDRHPNIVTAFMVEQIEGFPCLVLEYVEGGDLAQQLIEHGPLEIDRALELSIQFCDAMQYAHDSLGLVHRDIKPANCLITADGDLKVTDFGLARPFDPSNESQLPTRDRFELATTAHTTVIGTPRYMAPEQFDAEAQLDTRTDIHAFGIMLYEWLTGDLPLRGSVAQAHIESNASQYELPRELLQLIRRCVQPKPANRFHEFAAVRDELAEFNRAMFGAQAPPVASPSPMAQIDWSLKGIGLLTLEYYEEALECFNRALRSAPQNIVELLGNKGMTLNVLGRSKEALVCYDQGLEIAPRNISMWNNKGRMLFDLGRYEEALYCFDQGLDVAQDNYNSWVNKGIALAALGRNEEALICIDRALDLAPRNPILWRRKGMTLEKLERWEDAIACFDRGLGIAPRDGDLWFNKGVSLKALGRREEEIICYERGLEIDPLDAGMWKNKGVALAKLDRREEAIECYDRALSINPRDGDVWFNKGVSLRALGRCDEAIICYDRGLEIDPHDTGLWNRKGIALNAVGRHGEAIDCYDRGLGFAPREIALWQNKGQALQDLDRYEDALACYHRGLEIDPEDRELQEKRTEVGRLLEAKGK